MGPQILIASAASTPTPLSPTDYSLVTATGYTEGGYNPISAAPLAVPEFSWTAIDGAKSYRLQVSQNIGFSPVAFEVVTPSLSYTPTNSNNVPDGNLYWRVRVDSPIASNYSDPVFFIKRWATTDNAPALLFPANNSALGFYSSTTFSWQAVTGAARYRFQIATNPNGFNPPLYKVDTIALSHQPLTKLGNNIYYWRVVPLDPNDREGTPSEVWSFRLSYGLSVISTAQIPTLLTPANNSEPTFTPTFRWTAIQGAQYYDLQYTSDPSCNFGNAGLTKTVPTRNTTYTPTDALPNDFNYCWHVRVHSGNSLSDWSSTWNFIKRWYIQAIPLTPVNSYQYVKNPFFTWTPVPGAAYYKIEVCEGPSFPCPSGSDGYAMNAVNTYHIRHDWNWGVATRWYWRITPYDRNGNGGKPSDGNPYPRPVSFHHAYTNLSPNQVYPLYYYPPSTFPSPDTGLVVQPAEDRSVPYPVFLWNRTMDSLGVDAAAAYEIQVDDDPLFQSINWDYKTENTSAAPTSNNPFTPQTGINYYWRVCSLTSLGGACPATSRWSQVWVTRFNPSKAQIPTGQPTLLRPAPGAESVETMPLFEWWPQQGANSYQIQISLDPNFGSPIIDTITPYPVFSPQGSLGQRSLSHLGFGTYYWRVRGLSSGSPLSDWSSTWRFQLAAQSQWRVTRTPLAAANQLLVASDDDDVTNDSYELTNLNVAQDMHAWYFGFNFSGGEDMAYVLYIDLDHSDTIGATTDPRAAAVSTIAPHRPEYAIYLLKRGGGITADDAIIYQWIGTGWSDNPQTLQQTGGQVNISGNYVELRVENTSIGMGEDTNSASLSLVSINESQHTVIDAVPTSTTLSVLDRFTSVSERMNLVTPPTSITGDSTIYAGVPPFFFDYPSSTPWEGFNIQISVDSRFTTWLKDYTLYDGPYIAPPFSVEHTKVQDVAGDNTYYWRVRPAYIAASNIRGSWSQPRQFQRQGFVPQNLQESITFATPTFSWDYVEGAAYYDIEVDDDPNFGTPAVDKDTAQNTYTPEIALPNATYYWRVRVRRDTLTEGSNDWSQVKTFTLALPIPTNLTPDDPDPQHAVHAAPILCWDPMVIKVNGSATLTAYKYKVQVSRDPNFSPVYDQVDTEQTCYTPTKGYDDGTYYWRVAMIDGNDYIASFSPAATFTKQYPVASLLNPSNNAQVTSTPTFVWTPVNGAASYRLEVSQYATFSPTYDSVTTNNVRYTPTKSYDLQKTYYWRVAIIDKDGKTGPFTNAIILGNGGSSSGSSENFLPLIRRP